MSLIVVNCFNVVFLNTNFILYISWFGRCVLSPFGKNRSKHCSTLDVWHEVTSVKCWDNAGQVKTWEWQRKMVLCARWISSNAGYRTNMTLNYVQIFLNSVFLFISLISENHRWYLVNKHKELRSMWGVTFQSVLHCMCNHSPTTNTVRASYNHGIVVDDCP